MSTLDCVLSREYIRLTQELETLENSIKVLPCGYISRKKIGNKIYYYRQWREGKVLKSEYIRKPVLDDVIRDIEQRKMLDEKIKVVKNDLQRLKKVGSVSAFGLDIDTIIRQVDGSMAIEGMALSAEDKDRIRMTAFVPDNVEGVIKELVKKHSVVR